MALESNDPNLENNTANQINAVSSVALGRKGVITGTD